MREMSSLSLLDDGEAEEEEDVPEKEVPRHVETTHRPAPCPTRRLDMDRSVGVGVTGASVNARDLNRRSGCIQAGG